MVKNNIVTTLLVTTCAVLLLLIAGTSGLDNHLKATLNDKLNKLSAKIDAEKLTIQSNLLKIKEDIRNRHQKGSEQLEKTMLQHIQTFSNKSMIPHYMNILDDVKQRNKNLLDNNILVPRVQPVLRRQNKLLKSLKSYIATLIKVTPKYSLGAHNENPAYSCRQIVKLDKKSKDGYYWISPAKNVKEAFRVYCDMSNGGWALIGKFPAGVDYKDHHFVRELNVQYLNATEDVNSIAQLDFRRFDAFGSHYYIKSSNIKLADQKQSLYYFKIKKENKNKADKKCALSKLLTKEKTNKWNGCQTAVLHNFYLKENLREKDIKRFRKNTKPWAIIPDTDKSVTQVWIMDN